ncbi:unnamed protein product (macronuclear) [Paramecium tetraurelia]|uniref:Myb-like domain-containing protein n=1 Tax=Paramecium tetraurelia TaxID=5888 RepID=A0CIQ7_PARTE|nr:uncharacterized protein GSPATT00007809001 [Paramecium tetraurelia]CAK70674.1 unnamed protein product [Paramecium tetraurelia]|eukprot:XP_001438071.1 hypothetical protein (macronuclear) [Paramecium tetraurelia strain d4-2]
MNQQNSDAEMRFVNSTTSSPHTHKLARQIHPLEQTYSQQEYDSTPIPSNNLLVLTKKKIRKELSQNQKCNSGHWTPEEHQTYVEFLQNHQTQSISSQENKKNNKIFKLMSQTIGTRSPSQCRSHHQKFNPNTPVSQKRIKKTNKQLNSNFQIKLPINNLIKQFYTPDLKPNLEPMLNFQDCHESQDIQQEESFKIRIRKYSYSNFDDNQNIYNSHYNLLLE